ncbi:hypothetical protein ASF63_13905 [Microbacterium sp. Leaf320]|nr:hypothetical protein ASF63_13905 [Microbacterium sp. Leaf320]
MTDNKPLIAQAYRLAITDRISSEPVVALLVTLAGALEAAEKTHNATGHAKESDTSTERVKNGADSSHVTPTDDEVNAVALAYWGPSVTYDRERLRAALAGFRRSEPSAIAQAKTALSRALSRKQWREDGWEAPAIDVQEALDALSGSEVPEPSAEDEFAPGECDGSGKCSAPRHIHGCYTLHRADQCDAPDEYGHLPSEPQGETSDARGIIARRLIREARMDSFSAWDLADDIIAALRAAGVVGQEGESHG